MLSPLDLQNKKIVTKKRKYDKVEMDEYLELVFENYKELFNQNQELQKQVKTLSDGVQYYRSIESTMQKALVLAEKTSKETKDAAILKADAIEKDANSRAAKIISEAEQEYETIKDKCLYLVQQFNQYKMQLKQVAAAQLELITSDSFDVYSPELDALQHARNSLPVNEDAKSTMEQDTAKVDIPSSEIDIQPEKTDLQPEELTDTAQIQTPVAEKESTNTISLKPEMQSASNDTLTALDDTEEMASIIKDTVDNETNNLDKTMVIPDIKKELDKEETKLSEEDTLSILTADTIDLSDSLRKIQPETLEPIPEEETEGPTLDSLLQSINLGKKKKKKKGNDEDPFEFLGSVDDF